MAIATKFPFPDILCLNTVTKTTIRKIGPYSELVIIETRFLFH